MFFASCGVSLVTAHDYLKQINNGLQRAVTVAGEAVVSCCDRVGTFTEKYPMISVVVVASVFGYCMVKLDRVMRGRIESDGRFIFIRHRLSECDKR